LRDEELEGVVSGGVMGASLLRFLDLPHPFLAMGGETQLID
jgi:hypothetical protein